MLIDRRLLTHLNWGLLAALLALFAVGLLNLYSASGTRAEDGLALASFYRRQLIWGLGGFAAMTAVMSFDYRRLTTVSTFFYIVSVLALLMVPLFGKLVYGARRWLDLGVFNFQPSEMAKISVLLLGAQMLAKNAEVLSWKGLAQITAMGLVPTLLILTQPDLGTGLTVLFILGAMILYHGLTPAVLKTCLLTLPLFLPLTWFALHDYQKRRILTFLDPSNDPLGSGYHIMQSQIAIGSGQIWGKGFLHGTQSQLRFLPEKHTDFALAVLGEEWGFVGCILLLLLSCFFLLAIFNTVRDAKDRFGSTLAAGVFVYFFWQISINMGMVLGLMPVVGIPLPFISYGGSATILNFALVGLVQSVSMRRFMFKS
ncbi:MAG: rod shape-determining protein RodA [Desulfovibrionaceae bacterium]|nr:rod shape-determining protein RodA [Desulfovibrionaceae bacterium]